MRNFKHISFRYLFDRINFWRESKFNPDKPWLTSDAIRLLGELINQDDEMLEVGSGRSTSWFAQRVKSICSLEDNIDWYNIVSKSIAHQKLDNKVKYRLLASGQKYSEAISKIENKFDIILIDGGDRNECAIKSLGMLKENGVLIIDNANWYIPSPFHDPGSFVDSKDIKDPIWKQFHELTKSFRCIRTTNGLSDTFIYFNR